MPTIIILLIISEKLKWLHMTFAHHRILLGIKLSNKSKIDCKLLAMQTVLNLTRVLELGLETCGRLGLV